MKPVQRPADHETPPTGAVPPRKRRPWLGFTVPAALSVLAVLVLHGPIAGVAALAAMLTFIGACMIALRGQDQDRIAAGERSALGGWVGGWF